MQNKKYTVLPGKREARQVAMMEKPLPIVWERHQQSTRTEDPMAYALIELYNEHIESLPVIQLSPSLAERVEEGGFIVEWVDFENDYQIYLAGAIGWSSTTEEIYSRANKQIRRIVAVPLPAKQEWGSNEFEKYPELSKEIEWFANNVGVPGSHWNNLLHQINNALAQPTPAPVPEKAKGYLVYENNKVNSILTACLKELDTEQMIALRDALAERTPAPVQGEAGEPLLTKDEHRASFIGALNFWFNINHKRPHIGTPEIGDLLKEYEKAFINDYYQSAHGYPGEFTEWVSVAGWNFVGAINKWQNWDKKELATTAELFSGPYQEFIKQTKGGE